ncbi:MAG TPA: glycosyltransferase family 4 protein [Candidatus Udaeobacter sp.]|nr:glycosyltransferase family 4 protein [Candidatus Udaeobacter sp.]
MRVIHVIPSAFEYFDDIRSQAFKLLEELNKLGVETEAFTLQYGSPNREEKASIKEAAPSVHSHIGDFNAKNVIESFSDFDIVHLHCPFFGAAGKILRWKKLNPNSPLVITYYREIKLEDTFSLIIRLYNAYFLPKIFNLADASYRFNREQSTESIAAETLSVYNSFYTAN